MLFYIMIFIFCIIMLVFNNCLKEQKHKKIFEITTLIILCIISGTRYYLGGTDYYVYQQVFKAVPSIFRFDFNTIHNIYYTYGMEKGFLYFVSILKTIGFNFLGFTLIHSIIFYTGLYVGLKRYTKNFNFLIIIFMYKLFFYNTFISLRQSITLVIFFIAIRFIQERKAIKYFLCCALAVFFHNGALILFPIYFINKIKLTNKRIIILNCIFVPTLIISLMNIPILNYIKEMANLFTSQASTDKANAIVNSIPESRNKYIAYT